MLVGEVIIVVRGMIVLIIVVWCFVCYICERADQLGGSAVPRPIHGHPEGKPPEMAPFERLD